MKNLFSIIAVAGMTAIVACGPSAAEKAEKQKQDSIHIADSTAKIAAVAKAKADSAAAVEAKKAEMEKMKMDSIKASEEPKKKGDKKEPRKVETKKSAGHEKKTAPAPTLK